MNAFVSPSKPFNAQDTGKYELRKRRTNVDCPLEFCINESILYVEICNTLKYLEAGTQNTLTDKSIGTRSNYATWQKYACHLSYLD